MDTRTATPDRVAIPTMPDIPGLVVRHYRGETDLPGMSAANTAARLAYGVEEIASLEGMRAQYANLTNSDLHDDLVVLELDGRIVGYARVEVEDQTDASMALQTIGTILPELRGHGIGGALLDWIDDRARAIAPRMPADRERWIHVFGWDGDPYAARLFAKRGYEPVRRFYEMVRPTLDDIADAPLPDGIELRLVTRDDFRAIWEADNDMFRDHWGEIDESEASFRRFVEDERYDPSLFVVAWDGDRIAAHVLNVIDDEENRAHDRLFGIVDSVGTRREYRRRGLARALILRSLVLLRERGMQGAYLGVDSENTNRALHLYESCGFEVTSSSTIWRRPLAAALETRR